MEYDAGEGWRKSVGPMKGEVRKFIWGEVKEKYRTYDKKEMVTALSTSCLRTAI